MKIKNKGEKTFYNMMLAKGVELIYQPIVRLPSLKIRPDFYCKSKDVYYEIINTRQAYYQRRGKIQKAREGGLNIEVLRPNGEPFIGKRRINLLYYLRFIKPLTEPERFPAIRMTRRQLQRLIIQKGFTQTELAKKVGMPFPQILCSMLRGDRWAKDYRSQIAKILDIDESEIPQPLSRKT